MPNDLIDKKQLFDNLAAWVARYRTGSYEVSTPTLYKDCRDMLATINDLMERLEEVLAERLAGPADAAGPELPWALHTAEGYHRLRVHVWPSLEAPRTVALTVADGWAEFAADEIEEGIGAMTEAVRRIRAHASGKDTTEALPSEEEWPAEFLNAKVRFWLCPDHRRGSVEWRGDVAHCLEPGCGKTSEGRS